jgi:integrase
MKQNEYVYASIFADEINGYLELRKSQKHKVCRERYYFQTLDQYLCCHRCLEKALTVDTVEGWLLSLPETMHINTRIVYISHYSQFAKYLHSICIEAFVPERPIGTSLYSPYIFSQMEIDAMFTAADDNVSTSRNGKKGAIQFSMILRLLYGCGLRLDEALCLRAQDVDIETGVIYVRKGKGNKDRAVPMDQSLTNILRRYIDKTINGDDESALLFPNKNGKPRVQAWARYCFHRVLVGAGIEIPALPRYSRNICLHCLRHSFAVASFRKQDKTGVDMYASAPFLSEFLGHDQLDGTETYLHMTAENSADTIDRTQTYSRGLFPEVPQ